MTSELQAREQALIQWNLTFANPKDILSADDNEQMRKYRNE